MKRALITGCGGFVGRHFMRHLLDDGWKVTGVDDLYIGLRPDDEENLTFIVDDIRWFFIRHSFEAYDLIIHCAAVVGGRAKIEGDPLAIAQNFAIDVDFFRWVLRTPVKDQKIVYFSSSAAYPTMFQTREANCALSEPLVSLTGRIGAPDATYGWAKLMGEYLAQRAVERGIDVVIYRPFSGYGEDQDLAYPFPSIVKRAVSGQDPLTIWGSGDQVRDFIHIDDVVGCVMETAWKLKPGEALNIGSGMPVSFKELADLVLIAAKRTSRIVTDKTKPEGVFWRVADTSKMRTFYIPKVSLGDGIKRAVECTRLDAKALV